MTDIGFFPIASGAFDLRIQAGDIEKDGSLETAVFISLFTDKRVPREELPAFQTSQRGFWGDLFSGLEQDEIGSKLWLLAREKRTLETLRRGEDYAREALAWMVEDGIAASVETRAEFIGEVSDGHWKINIQISKPTGTLSRYEVLWDAERNKRG